MLADDLQRRGTHKVSSFNGTNDGCDGVSAVFCKPSYNSDHDVHNRRRFLECGHTYSAKSLTDKKKIPMQRCPECRSDLCLPPVANYVVRSIADVVGHLG